MIDLFSHLQWNTPDFLCSSSIELSLVGSSGLTLNKPSSSFLFTSLNWYILLDWKASNFLFMSQLFGFIKCPRHRLPRWTSIHYLWAMTMNWHIPTVYLKQLCEFNSSGSILRPDCWQGLKMERLLTYSWEYLAGCQKSHSVLDFLFSRWIANGLYIFTS